MKKVVLGMSGGVDSSVSAILLKEAGYEVIGATMKLNKQEDNIQEVKRICKTLGIEHYVFDCQKEFEQYVINDFIRSYQKAQTPNPCIVCNQHIKFDLFYQKARELGCDTIATGHYARN